MTNRMYKLFAILLAFSMAIPTLTFLSSAESIREGGSKDVLIYWHHYESTFTFTPDKSGIYEISANAPKGLLGKLIYLFTSNSSNPTIDISTTDESDYLIGRVDYSYGDEVTKFVHTYTDKDGNPYDEVSWAYNIASNFGRGYIYLEAGVTYVFECYEDHEEGVSRFKPFAFSACVDYIGTADVTCTLPEKTVYSISAGEAYPETYGDNPTVYYGTDMWEEIFVFDVTLSDGTHFKVDGAHLYSKVAEWKNFSRDENLGECVSAIYLFGQYYYFYYTIVE